MKRQRSFSIKNTIPLFISFTIPFSVLLSFWAFGSSNSASSQTQLLLSPGGLKDSKPEVSASSGTNLSVAEPKAMILMETHGPEAAVPPKASYSVEVGRNGDFTDTHLSNFTIWSSESMGLVGRSNGSIIGGAFSISSSNRTISSIVEEVGAEACDVSDGRWVYDESYPLYSSDSCPYIDEAFSCEANGRMDRDYMKWRWQPNHCNIPRFNPLNFLELIRGKRLVFVGDSINRNQWESMMCLLRIAIADPNRVYEARGRRITKEKGVYNFKFVDYQCSLEFYVSHFLVHESKARVRRKRVQTLRIDTMDRSSSKWRGADILVFNTGHWWHHYKTKAGVNYYQEGDKVHPHLNVSVAFSKSFMTWASWVDQNIDPNKTRVFFRSSSPSHFSGGEWNSGGHCKESTGPLNFTIVPSTPEKNLIIDQVIKQMKTPVIILNITSLSGLRIDGHPSIYGRKSGNQPSLSSQDCSHWCLPGVPDTWNELLYYYLQISHR